MGERRAPAAPGISTEREPVTAEELADAGVNLQRDFPEATVDDFRRYPVLTEGGWFTVIKHQTTLVTVSREPWDLFGPIKPLSYGLLP